jgi:hypothetical protein
VRTMSPRRSAPPSASWQEKRAHVLASLPPERITTSKEISDSCPYPQAASHHYEEGTTLLRLHLDEAGAVSAVARPPTGSHPIN